MRKPSRNPLRNPCEPPVFPRLRAWFRTPLGRALAAQEAALLRELLPTLFGYHMVVVDCPWEAFPVEASRIRNVWLMHSQADDAGQFMGQAEALPVRTDSLDTLVLPHVLEFARDPHALLREADRCLVPEGHLVLLGFQPWGAWGLRRMAGAWRGRPPWCGRWLGTGRVRDWCRLLGFDVLEVRPLFHRPPAARGGVLHHAAFLDRLAARGWPLPGGAWLVLARKRVIGLTPVRPRWRPRRSILSPLPGVAEPTRRERSR